MGRFVLKRRTYSSDDSHSEVAKKLDTYDAISTLVNMSDSDVLTEHGMVKEDPITNSLIKGAKVAGIAGTAVPLLYTGGAILAGGLPRVSGKRILRSAATSAILGGLLGGSSGYKETVNKNNTVEEYNRQLDSAQRKALKRLRGKNINRDYYQP